MIGHSVWPPRTPAAASASSRKRTLGLPSGRGLGAHAVVGGEADDEAGVERAADRDVDRAVELVGHRLARGGGVLDEVGQRRVDELRARAARRAPPRGRSCTGESRQS